MNLRAALPTRVSHVLRTSSRTPSPRQRQVEDAVPLPRRRLELEQGDPTQEDPARLVLVLLLEEGEGILGLSPLLLAIAGEALLEDALDLADPVGGLRASRPAPPSVITNNGKPIALLTPILDMDIEDTVSAVRRARATAAARKGLPRMTMKEVNKEIAEYRKSKKR